MKLINSVRLDHSHNNLIIQEVAENGVVIVNEIAWDDFIRPYVAELREQIDDLKNQIEDLRHARMQCEELACYKEKELQSQLIGLEERFTERENRFLEVAVQFSEQGQAGLVAGYELALEAFLDGRIDDALRLLDENRLREVECRQAEQRILRGNILYFQNRLEEAEYNLKRAVEVAPTLETYMVLGRFYGNIDRKGQACAVYRRALPFCSNDFERARVFSAIGEAHLKMKNFRAAKRYINRGYSVLTEYLSGQWCLLSIIECLEISCARAHLSLELHDYETAEKIFCDILGELDGFGEEEQVADFKAWILLNFARMLEETGRAEEALSMYARTISLYEVLSLKKPELNKPYLAQALLKYADLSPHAANNELREVYYLRAYELTHDESFPHFWHRTLTAEVVIALCLFYEVTSQQAMMQAYLPEARALLEDVYERDPDMYLPKLCYILEKQCVFGDADLRTEAMQRGMEVYEKMSKELQVRWSMLGAWFYFRMARRSETTISEDAEVYFGKALNLARQSIAERPEQQDELTYMEDCAFRYLLAKMSGMEA